MMETSGPVVSKSHKRKRSKTNKFKSQEIISGSAGGDVAHAPHSNGTINTPSSSAHQREEKQQRAVQSTPLRPGKVTTSSKDSGNNRTSEPADIRVKENKWVQIKTDASNTWTFPLQPNASAYGGLGFARPSTWLSMQEEQFSERFERVFGEHIEFGSTGKAFIKGFKREREANMLWRVKLRQKLGETESTDSTKKKKKGVKVLDNFSATDQQSAPKKQKVGDVSPTLSAQPQDGEMEESKKAGGLVQDGNNAAGKSKKERVKQRRLEAIVGQRRVIPKVEVNVSLQQSAIEAYRKLKENRKAQGTQGGRPAGFKPIGR